MEIWEFVKLLLGRWIVKILLLLVIASALLKYLPDYAAPSWVAHSIFDVALIVASWDVYKKKQAEVSALRVAAIGRSELVIYPQEGSRFYVRTEGGRAVATHVHLNLIIANKGTRISIINQYTLEVTEVDGVFSDIVPRPVAQIQGRKTLFVLGAPHWLAEGNIIKVQAGESTPRAILPLMISAVVPDAVRFIHCNIILHDDAGTEVSCKLEVTGD